MESKIREGEKCCDLEASPPGLRIKDRKEDGNTQNRGPPMIRIKRPGDNCSCGYRIEVSHLDLQDYKFATCVICAKNSILIASHDVFDSGAILTSEVKAWLD